MSLRFRKDVFDFNGNTQGFMPSGEHITGFRSKGASMRPTHVSEFCMKVCNLRNAH